MSCCNSRRRRRKIKYDPDLPVLRSKVWPGNNVPLWNGKLLRGPDVITYIIAFILIIIPAVGFIGFTCVDLFRYVHWIAGLLILAAGVMMLLWNVYSLIRCGTIDPGVLPKNIECYREFFLTNVTQTAATATNISSGDNHVAHDETSMLIDLYVCWSCVLNVV